MEEGEEEEIEEVQPARIRVDFWVKLRRLFSAIFAIFLHCCVISRIQGEMKGKAVKIQEQRWQQPQENIFIWSKWGMKTILCKFVQKSQFILVFWWINGVSCFMRLLLFLKNIFYWNWGGLICVSILHTRIYNLVFRIGYTLLKYLFSRFTLWKVFHV